MHPMAGQVQMEPASAEAPALPASEVGHRDRDDPARTQGGRHPLQVHHGIGHVLERVLKHREVVGGGFEPHLA
jgi:hypothetical protein